MFLDAGANWAEAAEVIAVVLVIGFLSWLRDRRKANDEED